MKTITTTIASKAGPLEVNATVVSRTKGAMVITEGSLHGPVHYSITHRPTGHALPGLYKSRRTAVRLAHGWWDRLTDEQREFFMPGRENYDGRRQSDDARDWYMKQCRKFRVR